MSSKPSPPSHELPHREVFALPRGSWPRHYRDDLRRVANEFHLTKRRTFYALCHELAQRYYVDRIVEEDLLHSTKAKIMFGRMLKNGTKLLEDLDVLFNNRPLYSLWNEPYFTCDGDLEEIAFAFRRDELPDQLRYFVILTAHAFTKLKNLSPSRKKRLALRKWANGHLDFWSNELGRPITIINDLRDGYSPCHSLLRALLEQIDPDSLGSLGPILRERKG